MEERDGDVGRGERRKQTSQRFGEGAEPSMKLSSQYSFQLGNKDNRDSLAYIRNEC